MPEQIFISYSRRDLAVVKPIKDELEAQGISCWMDLDGIESGEKNFKQKIVPAIDGCCAVLFFISVDSQKSKWTAKELDYAERHEKRVVPLRFNDDPLVGVFDFDYGGSDIIDWRKSEQKKKLLHDLCAWAEMPSPSAPPIVGQPLVDCPVCGKKNRPEDTFRCRECGRGNLCLRHQDEKSFLCADCTAKRVREEAERQTANIRMNTRRAIEESNNGNYGKAYEFAQKADLNNAAIQGIIGYALVNGIGCDRDVQRGIDWWLKAAMQGSAPFQYNLGVLYFEGKDVGQDDLEAVKWFKKAAESGYAPAQASLASCYACARGVSKSESEAVMWCRKAAEKGFVPAQYNMGALYYNGCKVIAKDEARKWLRMAAGKGNSEATKLLSLIEEEGNDAQGLYEQAENYYRGQNGVKKDRGKALECFEKAAELGCVAESESATFLENGLLAYNGIRRPKNYDEAVRWLRLAAKLGVPRAQHKLGVCYANGQGIVQDYVEAVKWYRQAAEQEYEMAQNSLGIMYAQGLGVEQDDAEAVKWYRKAAERGHADAQYNLGVMYTQGRGVSQDYDEAVKWYRKAAERGHADAQYKLGLIYAHGFDVPRDDAEAVKWYRKAAEQGRAEAQYELGKMYFEGQGVPKDDMEAVKLIRKAAEQGNIEAQNGLGWMCENGFGMPKDGVDAVKWYSKAAGQGSRDASYNLIAMTRKDCAETVKWCLKVAEQGEGNVWALFALGWIYENGGSGVPQDYVEAVKWYRKAAEQGHVDAQYELGKMYESGHGVPQDYIEAVKWYRKTAEQGDADAKEHLESILKNAVNDESYEAKSLARALSSHAGEVVVCRECGKCNILRDSIKCTACGSILL